MAYSGLMALSEITVRQIELATQAESVNISYTQRQVLNDEANALVDEYNRIVESTAWNKLNPPDPTSAAFIAVQAGYGSEASISLRYGQELKREVMPEEFVTTMPYLDLMSTTTATESAAVSDAALNRVTQELGVVKAQTSRLGAALMNVQSAQLNFEVGYHRIMEIDAAEGTATYVRTRIVQDSANAMPAQADQETADVLRLLESVAGGKRKKLSNNMISPRNWTLECLIRIAPPFTIDSQKSGCEL